jgi:hypothetical protein
MPASSFVIPSFIVFGGSAMGLGRKFVLLGGLSVCFVHDSSRGTLLNKGLLHEADQSFPDRIRVAWIARVARNKIRCDHRSSHDHISLLAAALPPCAGPLLYRLVARNHIGIFAALRFGAPPAL